MFPDHRPPALPGRPGPLAKEARMSIERPGLDPEDDLIALERRLEGWRPVANFCAVDRDRLFYEAGRAAARSRVHPAWLSTACLALVALTLGGLLVHERDN